MYVRITNEREVFFTRPGVEWPRITTSPTSTVFHRVAE